MIKQILERLISYDCNKHGHKFEARYTEHLNKNVELEVDRVSGGGLSTLRKMLVSEEYVGDVCTKCGKEINKLKSNKNTKSLYTKREGPLFVSRYPKDQRDWHQIMLEERIGK